ncbi:SRPBCC family protein [Streptomyces sp. B6B3]|uniref:SRPBCC family protein n=1 Tax=Streptomyces sp. B6B3 TaxID=3153570 RepID=UPI00325DD2C3
MGSTEASVDVDVPVHTAYNQWTHLESFRHFMSGVRSVDRPRPTLTHWVVRVGPLTREFDAEIVEQRPDERLAWRTLHQPRHTGTVTFTALGDQRCRIALRIDTAPRGLVERTGETLGVTRRKVRSDLARFKEFIEEQERETGRWHGEISGSHVRPDAEAKGPDVPDWPHG